MGNPKKIVNILFQTILVQSLEALVEIKGNKCKILLENIPKSFRLRVNSIINRKEMSYLAILFYLLICLHNNVIVNLKPTSFRL